jgi:prepilin-type N-terminal cleavage/methylation domain-containing protein
VLGRPPSGQGTKRMSDLRQSRTKGFTLIELLIVVTIIALLSAIAIPNLLSAQRKTRYSRAASDAKTATTQAVVYAIDRNVYPTTIAAIREATLTNLSDTDPWGTAYVLSPTLTAGMTPGYSDDVYIFSKGPYGNGVFPTPFIPNTGAGGSVGYSSVYGSWTGL